MNKTDNFFVIHNFNTVPDELIELCQDMELSRAETKARIVRKFSLSEEKAESYMQQYWK